MNPILIGLGILIVGMVGLVIFLAWKNGGPPTRAATQPAPEVVRIHTGGSTWLLYRVDLFHGVSVWVDPTGRLYELDVKTKTATRILPMPAPPQDVTKDEWVDQQNAQRSRGTVFDVGTSAWAELGLDAEVDHVGTLMDRAYEDGKAGRQVPSEGTHSAMVRLRRMLARKSKG